jgi:prefoldin alpha subunit
MDQEGLFKAQFLQQQAQELEQNLELVDGEIEKLQQMDSNLNFFLGNNEKAMISTIGKGIHVKANLEGKELFVEVGAGVVVKKTPEDARAVIMKQIQKLSEARVHMLGKLEIYHETIRRFIEQMQSQQLAEKKNSE